MARDGHKSFLIHLDYGNRAAEKEFVTEVLNKYDRDTLVGAVLFVNNNPYRLELLFFLNFKKRAEEFSEWLQRNYPSKRRIYNTSIDNIFEAMTRSGYNVMGLVDPDMLDLQMTSKVNEIFMFPDKLVMSTIFGNIDVSQNFVVFLSHSNKDKPIVDKVFDELQKAQVHCWYDRYEILPGDSISDRLNEGLATSNIGLLFISRSFLTSEMYWTKAEANYFIQQRMRTKQTKFIIVNLDVEHTELPPLMQDYRYIDFRGKGAMEQIVTTIRRLSADHPEC